MLQNFCYANIFQNNPQVNSNIISLLSGFKQDLNPSFTFNDYTFFLILLFA